MTRQKHLKQHVRERMARTGERYSTARRHVLAARPADPRQPGIHPETAALRALLAAAGLPLTEELVLAIGGGVGAGVMAFRYDEFSSFYVAGRHLWHDSPAFLRRSCARLGARAVIEETGGPARAARALDIALDRGIPVIAWVDAAALPHRGLPATWSGGGYHVVVVHGRSDGGYLVGDLADALLHVPAPVLAAARARIRSQRHRLLWLEGVPPSPDLAVALRDGVTACARGLVQGRARTFTVDAFARWADRLGGSGTDSWAEVFPPGPRLWRGLWSIVEFVEHWGTGGGLLRPMYARALAEAQGILADARLAGPAERYAELGRRWSALARAALPAEIEAFEQAWVLLEESDVRFHADGAQAAERVRASRERLEGLGAELDETWPLSPTQTSELMADLRQRVREIATLERAAAQELGSLA